jgi:hypothetical protein
MYTKADVIAKFKELHNKHYVQRGYMISTVPDEISDAFYVWDNNPQFIWNETYNRYVSDRVHILSCRVRVPLMGRTFKIRLDRPLEREDRYEFESYFGFGGHCEGYTANRIIACYPERFDDETNIDELLLNGSAATDPADDDYAKQVLMMIVMGGYVKFWNAVGEFEKWFGIEDKTGIKLITHIFETMEPEPLPEPVS